MPPIMTKSKFKLACECPTKLYYVDKAQYANQQAEDSFLKALAESGYQVEALARCYYPDGQQVETIDNETAVEATKRLLQNDTIALFEATIQYQQYLVRTDILLKNNKHLKIIEVKSKSFDKQALGSMVKRDGTINGKWKPYIADVAFQKWVLSRAFPDSRISSYLMLVDKDSICPTDGLNQKFLPEKDASGQLKVKILESLAEEDLSVKLLKEINVDHLTDKIWSECDTSGRSFKDVFFEFSQLYFKDEKVTPVPKNACKTCQFKTLPNDKSALLSGFKECWKQALGYDDQDFDDPTILDLWSLGAKEKDFQKGLIKLKDFEESDLLIKPDDRPGISASERQWKQIEKIKNNDNSLWLDEQGLRDEIQSWNYPLHFIDFETAMLPIPFSKGAHPYQGIAFQYSHHTLDKNGVVKHAGEYLHTEPGVDPSIEFVRSLKAELENDSGTIFRYSPHENTYLNQILSLLEDMADPPDDKQALIDFIISITKSTNDSRKKWHGNRCMVDLWKLVKRYYYDPMTKGSNSIKKVFPSVLNRSQYLQDKYSQPIYGSSEGISSKNFERFQWIVWEDGEIVDPYILLGPIDKDVPNDKIELLFEDEYLKEGGAATIAFAKLQFTHMSSFERNALRKALLKYCELDTLAMVMIVEAWIDMLR